MQNYYYYYLLFLFYAYIIICYFIFIFFFRSQKFDGKIVSFSVKEKYFSVFIILPKLLQNN